MAWLDDRLQAVEAAIENAEAAETEIVTGVTSSYTMDTGQTRTSVTRHNISQLRNYIDALYNRRATLLARMGRGARTMRPDY